MSNVQRDALEAALEKLRRAPDHSIDAQMQRVVEAATSLFGVTGAGLMFVDGADMLRYVAASDDASQVLEHAQEQLGSGPCVDCLVLGATVTTPDLAADPRWPGLAELVSPAGVCAVAGVPVVVGGGAVGSLNAYSNERRDWDESDVSALDAFAGIVEGVLGSAVLAHDRGQLVDQLQYALDHRVVIERAIGLVMGRSGENDPVTAFNRIRTIARSERRRVADVAADLLSGARPWTAVD